MELSSENIEKVIRVCLYRNGEEILNPVLSHGVIMKIGFHPDRIKQNTDNILSMLKCLPDDFMVSKGGGTSFLNACQNRDGVQWADLHDTVDKLVVLGLACKKLSFTMPREMWHILPGTMPYLTVIDI